MFSHAPSLLRLALPLILSSSTITMMQIVDAFVLSLHSSEAVAAMGPSSLAVVLFQSFLFGTAGYAGTFVAHSHGRGDEGGIRQAAWLGVHASLISGLAALALAWPLGSLFLFAGHEPQVARDERVYFAICMAGSLFPVLGGALGGWLAGIGRAVTVTWVTLVSFAVNAVLDWGLVLGEWGFPRMGIAGAALGTVAAQLVAAGLYATLFAMSGGFADRLARRFRWAEFRRFLSLATPMGFRISIELVAWTFFLLILGRLGTVELAASSIAFRINGTAFFPAWAWPRPRASWPVGPAGPDGTKTSCPSPGSPWPSASCGSRSWQSSSPRPRSRWWPFSPVRAPKARPSSKPDP